MPSDVSGEIGQGHSEVCKVYLDMTLQGSAMTFLYDIYARNDGISPNTETRRALRAYAMPDNCPVEASYSERRRVLVKRIKARGYRDDDVALQRLMEAWAMSPICKGARQ